MRLAYTDDQEAMRSEIRAYYAELLDPETRKAIHEDSQGPVMRRVVKQMASDGWLGVGLAKGVRRAGQERHRAVHLL